MADGEVISVNYLDEFVSVAVRHGKYITVYNRLTDVNVVNKQKISLGLVIGKAAVGDKGGGEVEFRVMTTQGNRFLNPEAWLIRR